MIQDTLPGQNPQSQREPIFVPSLNRYVVPDWDPRRMTEEENQLMLRAKARLERLLELNKGRPHLF